MSSSIWSSIANWNFDIFDVWYSFKCWEAVSSLLSIDYCDCHVRVSLVTFIQTLESLDMIWYHFMNYTYICFCVCRYATKSSSKYLSKTVPLPSLKLRFCSENGPSQNEIHLPTIHFHEQTVSFREFRIHVVHILYDIIIVVHIYIFIFVYMYLVYVTLCLATNIIIYI